MTLHRIAELNKEWREKYRSKPGIQEVPPVEGIITAITDPIRMEMHQLINTLPQNQKDELSAIVWLGRGDFADFETAIDYATRFHGEDAGSYLGAKPLFKYIPEGVEALRAEGIVFSA